MLGGPASTLALADDLARLMDDMATRGVDWSALDGLVPDALDQYWQLTLDFLKIARDYWPAILRKPAGSNRRCGATADRGRSRTPADHHAGPVIAAGSTGSMPSTAKLLHVIAKLPQGAVVLPGLDTDLDEEAWQLIGGATRQWRIRSPPGVGHPQFALHGAAPEFGITRRDVKRSARPRRGRELLMSEAMRPSEATAQWHTRLAKPEVAEKIAAGCRTSP